MVHILLIELVFSRVAVAMVEEHKTLTRLSNLPQNRKGLGLRDIGRIMRHLRTFQLTHAHPGTKGSKPGRGLRLSHEAVESPQRQFQKASEHDFTEQVGINFFIVVVLQSLLGQ